MATTPLLRTLEHAHWEFVLVIEGLRYFWTTSAYLAALDFCGDGREGKAGLLWPRWTLEIGPLDGQGREHQTSFVIQDERTGVSGSQRSGYLAELFAVHDDSEEVLLTSFGPGDPAPAQAHGMHVGTETIGPAGERGRYPIVPGFHFAQEHIGQDLQTAEHVLSTVSERPVVMRGRRVALYQVFRDVVDFRDSPAQGWRPWSEAVLRFVGELLDSGSVDGPRWTLRCSSPWKLLDRTIGSLSQSVPARVSVPIKLEPEERRAAVRFHSFRSSPVGFNRRNYGTVVFGESLGAWSGEFAPQYDNPQQLVAAVKQLIDAVANDATTGFDGAFNGDDRGTSIEVVQPTGEFRIRINRAAQQVNGEVHCALAEVCFHEKVWYGMGYDPPNQVALPPDDPDFVHFYQSDSFSSLSLIALIGPTLGENTPPGYWTAYISTLAAAEGVFLFGPLGTGAWDNGGAWREWEPAYKGGASALPEDPGEGLELILGSGWDEVWHTGQLDRPVPGDANGAYTLPVGACDTQGLWLLQGPRRMAGEEDPEDEAQIVRLGWRKTGYAQVLVDGGQPNAVLTEWISPEAYGIPRKLLKGSWALLQNVEAENSVMATPLLRLGRSPNNGPDRPDIMLLRLLLNTGTSDGWSSFSDDANAQLDPGDNSLELGGVVLDGEIPDLGLAIPRQLVHDPTEWAAVYEALPPGSYRGWQLAFVPPLRTRDVVEGLFESLGWCWHFRDGKFGIFDITQTLTPDDADIVITPAQKRGSFKNPSSVRTDQEIRAYAPIDHFSLAYDWNPLTRAHNETYDVKSPDKGARYRARTVERPSEPLTTRSHTGWEVRAKEVADFLERRHFWLKRFPIKHRRPGMDVWPGTRVLVTEPRAVSQTGRYGVVAHAGIVIAVTHDSSVGRAGQDQPACVADILVQDHGPRWTLYAPSARGRGFHAGWLHVDDNWLELPTVGWLDVHGFQEPSWSNFGGRYYGQCLQWDGRGWSLTLAGRIVGIDATPGACRIQLVDTSGTYRRDDDCIFVLQPKAQQEQDSWVDRLLGVICDDAGEYATGLLGPTWMGV